MTGYYTALNTKSDFIPKNGKIVSDIKCNNQTFHIYEHIGRYYLFIDNYQLSEIINGKDGFIKKYKGNYRKWVESVKNKDLVKCQKLRKMANAIIKDAELIEKIWSKNKLK